MLKVNSVYTKIKEIVKIMTNLFEKTLEKINIPLSSYFFINVASGFLTSFTITKYINKEVAESPFIAFYSSIPSILLGLSGNDHQLAGNSLGSIAASSLVNPLRGLASTIPIIHEIYCNINECDKNSNIVTRNLPISEKFFSLSLIYTAYPAILLFATKHFLGNKADKSSLSIILATSFASYGLFNKEKSNITLSSGITGLSIASSVIYPSFLGLAPTGIALEIYCNNYSCTNKRELLENYLGSYLYQELETKFYLFSMGINSVLFFQITNNFITQKSSYNSVFLSSLIFQLSSVNKTLQEHLNILLGSAFITSFTYNKENYLLSPIVAFNVLCLYYNKITLNDITSSIGLEPYFITDLSVSYSFSLIFGSAMMFAVDTSNKFLTYNIDRNYISKISNFMVMTVPLFVKVPTPYGNMLGWNAGSMLSFTMSTDYKYSLSAFATITALEILNNINENNFIKYSLINAISSYNFLQLTKCIGIENNDYQNNKALAFFIATIPGALIATTASDNHEILGSIAGGCAALANISPEISAICISLAGAGDFFLGNSSEVNS